MSHPDVPSGDLAVAIVNGSRDKVTYLAVDLTAIPTGATVTKALLTFHEDPAGTSVNQSAAKIVADPAKGFVVGGSEGAPFSEAPGSDGSGPTAKGTRLPTGTWTFDVTALIGAEASGAKTTNGIALVPDSNSDNFEIVWKGSLTMLDVTTSGSGSTTTSALAVIPSASPPTTTSTDTSSSGNVAPVSSGDTIPATSPAQPVTTLGSVAAPVTVAPAPKTAGRRGRPGLTLPFYLVVLGVLGVAALGTVVLGDAGEPAERRQGRVLGRIEGHTASLP